MKTLALLVRAAARLGGQSAYRDTDAGRPLRVEDAAVTEPQRPPFPPR